MNIHSETFGEAAARAERQRTNDFAATLNGWFWETDADDRFIYLSPNVERITGLSPKWHYGKRRIDLGCPKSITSDEWKVHLETLVNRRPFMNFVFLRTGPLGDQWLCTSGNPIHDAKGVFRGYRGTAADVTTEIEARDRAIRLTTAIEEKARILETTLRTIPDGVQVVDKDLNMVAWNDQLFDVLDLDKERHLSAELPVHAMLRTLAERGEYGPGDIETLVASREAIFQGNEPVHYERRLTTGKWIECRGSPIDGGSFMAVYRDITRIRAMISRLQQQASVDPLTGALNRRRFMAIAETEFSRARRYGRPLSLIVLDIDHFKEVNDTHGHGAGDATLRQVVKTLKKGLRETDEVGRFGGEEFVLMLPETGAEGAEVVAERLRRAIASMRVPDQDATIRITVSAGVAPLAECHHQVDDMISAADDALYQAKRAGRNRVVKSEPPMPEDAEDAADLARGL